MVLLMVPKPNLQPNFGCRTDRSDDRALHVAVAHLGNLRADVGHGKRVADGQDKPVRSATRTVDKGCLPRTRTADGDKSSAHRALDEAVAAAYGWPADLSDDAILEKLLALNLDRAGANG